MAVQLLHALSPARVVALDLDEGKLALAREVGADEAIRSGPEAADELRELTHGLGAELVLDMVGGDATMALAAACSRVQGDTVVIGLAGGALELRFGGVPFETAVTIPYWGSAVELMEVLELARSGDVRAHVETFPLERAADAYEKLRAGDVDGRAVVVPHG